MASRLTNFINEKVNKKEIAEALASTDVQVGAEWEFKIDNSFFQDEWDNKQERMDLSIQYDEDMENFYEEHRKWDDKKDEARRTLRAEARRELRESLGDDEDNEYVSDEFDEKVDDLFNEKMRDWYEENSEPERPDRPDGYIDEWRREHGQDSEVEFDERERILIDFMENDKNLVEYARRGGWEIHEDSSLEEGNGIELVSPPMPINKFMIACERIFKMIERIGYTDNECGLHIGVSLTSGMDKVDTTKMALFMEEGFIWKNFDGRKANQYVQSAQRLMRSTMYQSPRNWGAPQTTTIENIYKLKNMIREGKVKYSLSSDHYHAMNIQHMDESDPYIEFRYLGGTGYEKKWDAIKVVLAQYIYNLKLARDPNFKKKEYILKCNRILMKLESWAVMKEIRKLKDEQDYWSTEDKDVWGNEPNPKAKEKAIKDLTKRLTFLPRLSDSEERLLRDAGA